MNGSQQGFDKDRTISTRLLVAIFVASVATGIVSWLFLLGLETVSAWRESEPNLILLAPLVGLITVGLFQKVSPASSSGGTLVPKLLRGNSRNLSFAGLPQALAPLIVFSTWISHLAGLSVGREGTAVQAGAGLAGTIGRKAGLSDGEQRRWLLQAGVAAGFGSVFGVPIAGAVFAFELGGDLSGTDRLLRSRLPLRFLVCFAASVVADRVARLCGAHHFAYPVPRWSDWITTTGFLGLIATTVASAALAWAFLFLLTGFRAIFARLIPRAGLRPVIGGLLFAPLAFAPRDFLLYAGLGTHEIADAFVAGKPAHEALLKLVFTVFSVGAGFKGGEVTPLFFIGATSASYLAGFFALAPASLAALGLVAVFGAAAGVPLACAAMAGELFGPATFLAALPVCLVANGLCRSTKLYVDGHASPAKPDVADI